MMGEPSRRRRRTAAIADADLLSADVRRNLALTFDERVRLNKLRQAARAEREAEEAAKRHRKKRRKATH